MSDNNLENEFKSILGDDSLYKKLGEEKARKVLTMLKQMLGQEDDKKIFKPSLFKNISEKLKNDENLREPDDIIERIEGNQHIVEKFWKDKDGKIILTQIESTNIDKPSNNDFPNFESMDFNLPANIGLPMIIGINPLDVGMNNGFLDFIKNSTIGKRVKKKRTLEELLEKAVEVENYDLAADVKKILDYSPEFIAAFKKDMAVATEKEDVVTINKLTKIYDQHKKDIQHLIDSNESLFND